MREELLETPASGMDLYPRLILRMAYIPVVIRLLLHSSCDIKGAKWFLLLCLLRSDLTVTVQAVVQLIQQVHLHCCKQPL